MCTSVATSPNGNPTVKTTSTMMPIIVNSECSADPHSIMGYADKSWTLGPMPRLISRHWKTDAAYLLVLR